MISQCAIVPLAHFLPALIFAHRARCAALMRSNPAGDIFRLGLAAVLLPPRSLAHLALWALAIRARADALMVRPVRVVAALPLPFKEVSALMALSRRLRSSSSCWMMLLKFAMHRIVHGTSDRHIDSELIIPPCPIHPRNT